MGETAAEVGKLSQVVSSGMRRRDVGLLLVRCCWSAARCAKRKWMRIIVLDLLDGRLGVAQIESYWADGFLHPINVLGVEVARIARADLEKAERDFLAADLLQAQNTYKRSNAHVTMPFADQLERLRPARWRGRQIIGTSPA